MSEIVHGSKEAIAGAALLAASVTGWALDFGPVLFAATGAFMIAIGFWKNNSLQTDTERTATEGKSDR